MDYIRRHRNTINPQPGESPSSRNPTPGDLEIFRAPRPARFGYRFLPSHYIHHFVGGNNSTW